MYASRVCGAEDSSCTQIRPASTTPATTTIPKVSPYVFESRAAPPGVQAAGSGGRARTSSRPIDESRPQIRSGSVTGSRQRAHLPR